MIKLKGIIYDWILRLATVGFRKRASHKKLLIVRVDEIGDFMLWHSFLNEMVSAERFKDYEFHFCGNQSWKTLFQNFDAAFVQKSFWLDKQIFKKEMPYRYRFLKKIYQEKYDTVINPTFSRDKRYDDSIVKAAKAQHTIGMTANLESVQSYEIGYDRHLYTQVFDHKEYPVFEFYRNKLFTEFVIRKKSAVTDTLIAPESLPTLSIELPEKYFVVFPGSRSKARIWPTENFDRVSSYLAENYGWTAIVCGTKTDTAYTNTFCDQYKQPFIDLTGKTSLIEMLSLLKNAQCLLSVDTGSVHLAAAVGCTVFGIFNGSQYQRFAPYPANMAPNFYAVYPDEVEEELTNAELIKQKYEFVIPVPYTSVKPEKVILAVYQHYLGKEIGNNQ